MTEAARIAERIQRQIPALKQGTLRFWGQWFGRPHDNLHTVTGASADGDSLLVTFDEGETLLVVQPADAIVDEATFTIGGAASVRWEWNAYGNPPGPRRFREYTRSGSEAAVEIV